MLNFVADSPTCVTAGRKALAGEQRDGDHGPVSAADARTGDGGVLLTTTTRAMAVALPPAADGHRGLGLYAHHSTFTLLTS
jgi:hypothetical protein